MTPLPRNLSARYFSEGEQAFKDGMEKDACPHAGDSAEAPYWYAGWDAASYANDVILTGEAEDRRLDARYA